jgi:zinc dependent phospholipase C
MRPAWRVFAYLIIWAFCPPLGGYSVLTHEAIIDSAWERSIQPVLLGKFPQASAAELTDAHAHAYAGCIIQDMGYYPFGARFFSDLVHYLRSGDFVVNLIHEAQTLNEYAFALGALAHYAADTQGHGVAVNRSVAIEYPKLARRFGFKVTYGDDPPSHLKVEFSFDVLHVARGSYAPQAYHDFIGFHVSKEVLERAFHETYSLQLSDVFNDLDLALGTYRHVVSSTIPNMTRVAWRLKKDELLKVRPGITRRAFIYNLSKASYRKEWDGRYQQPGAGAAFLAFLIRITPKVGPLKALAFKAPTAQTERLFEESFDRTLNEYRRLLAEVSNGRLVLDNRDLDTGQPTRPAEYVLADRAYAKLAIKLAEKPTEMVDSKLRNNVLSYYRDLDLPFATKRERKEWQETLAALQKLKAQMPAAENRAEVTGLP